MYIWAQQLQSALGPEKKVVEENEKERVWEGCEMDKRREVKLNFAMETKGGNDGDKWCSFFLQQSRKAAHCYPSTTAAKRTAKSVTLCFRLLILACTGSELYHSFRMPAVKQPD